MGIMKRGICRDHGGVFHYPPRRGPAPVRCKPEFPCDKAEEEQQPELHPAPGLMDRIKRLPRKPAESNGEAPKPENPSLPPAMAAKKQLEAVGWVCKGRAWIENASEGTYASEVVASRDAETLVIQWLNGQVVTQDYSMEYLKPSGNNIPANNLGFDVNEMTDRELVQRISGMKVTWWNTLASSTESAVVPGEKVTVQHIFYGNGDEDNSKRIVTFVDRNAGGFRSFHANALMKVG